MASISQILSSMKRKHVNMISKNYFYDGGVHEAKCMFTMNTIFDQYHSSFYALIKKRQKSVFFRIHKHVFGIHKPTLPLQKVVTIIVRVRFLCCTGSSALSCVTQAKAANISPIRLFFRPCGAKMTRRKTLVRARSLSHRPPPSLFGIAGAHT